MKTSDFDYDLPTELIAQTPIEPRDHSRLLILDKHDNSLKEKRFYDILDYLWPNDVLVLNKTKVINARLKWILKVENSEVEVFLHKKIDNFTWDCLVYPGKKLKLEKFLVFDFWLEARVLDISDSGRIIRFNKWWEEFLDIIEKIGQTPIPPYVKEKLKDSSKYQTVFNEVPGSVAAPTAWLHFTEELLSKLVEKWVNIEKVLLHIWLGTFKWVESENIIDHNMHSEYIELEEEVSIRLNKYKKEKKRIIAVGTTSIRVLESFSNKDWILYPGKKETDIFIYPGYSWKIVDSIITNFHLPKSTLFMLVSSFAGKDFIMDAYKYAILNKFRFFSFWDAMWIK